MTTNLTRRSLLAGLSAAAAGSLMGCGFSPGASGKPAGTGKSVQAAWYGGDPVHKAMAQALSLFSKKYPDVNLSSWHDPYGDFWPKYATQVSGNTAPDVSRMSIAYFLEYVHRGALMDISAAIGKSINVSDLDPSDADSGKVDGKYYGVGQSSITEAIFYSPSRIKAVGGSLPDGSWTWKTFADFANGYAQSAGKDKFGTSDQGGSIVTFEVWARQHGSDLFSADGKAVAFSQDTLASWFDYWDKLRKSKGAPPASVTAESTGFPQSPLTKQLSPLEFGWIQQIVFFQPLNKDALEETSLPGMSPGDLKGQYVKSLDLWAVSSTSKSADADFELINFLINDEAAIKALGMTLGVPPSKKARKLISETADSATSKALAYLERVQGQVGPTPPAWASGYGQISDLLNRTNQDIGFGQRSVADATETFFAQAKSIMQSA